MFNPERGGERQFNLSPQESGFERWGNLNLTERIEEIKRSGGTIPTAEAIIFENLHKIPQKEIKELSTPLQRIVEEIARRLEKGE